MMYYIEATKRGIIEFKFATDLKEAEKIFDDFENKKQYFEPCAGDGLFLTKIDDEWLKNIIISEENSDILEYGLVRYLDWTGEY